MSTLFVVLFLNGGFITCIFINHAQITFNSAHFTEGTVLFLQHVCLCADVSVCVCVSIIIPAAKVFNGTHFTKYISLVLQIVCLCGCLCVCV